MTYMNDAGAGADCGVPNTTEAGLPGSSPTCGPTARATHRGQKSRRAALLIILLGIIAYSAYERLTTHANADRVVAFESYGDDAVAVGLTDDQPGFVLLSGLPQEKVQVEAQVATSWLTGKHTILGVRTPSRSERIRMRAPLVILVPENGTIVPVDVGWSHADFQELVHAADCESGCQAHPHRCGQPLDDIASALAKWPVDRVPLAIRTFLLKVGSQP